MIYTFFSTFMPRQSLYSTSLSMSETSSGYSEPRFCAVADATIMPSGTGCAETDIHLLFGLLQETSCELALDPDQSHLPSSQPSFHLCFQKLQSNSFFPSFTLTALCARHIHMPKSSLPFSFGSFSGWAIQSLKSSAHTQQGYIFENKLRN
jgi:hypothetical protein